MHIRVDRDFSNKEATLSKIYLDDVFYCYGLEDQYQEIKIQDETRIPAGTYNIKLRNAGSMTKKYSARYSFHRGMLHIQDVPGFEYIYIHTGNNDNQSSGCLLVGLKRNEGTYVITSSRDGYKKLYVAVVDAAAENDLTITFEDNDIIKSSPPPLKPGSLALSQASCLLTEDQMPLLKPLPMADNDSHRNWKVMEDWYLKCIPLNITFFIPKGFIFNGASVPRFFSNIFPSTGYLFIAALIHDYLYGYASYLKSFEYTDGVPYSLVIKVTRKESDNIFEDIADWLYKDHWFKTKLAKTALVLGGQGAWDDCRKIDGTYVKPLPYKYEDDDDFMN